MSLASNTGSRSKPYSSKTKITLEGCSEGDVVAIVWNPEHGQYIIIQVCYNYLVLLLINAKKIKSMFQDSPILFFLHELSHKKLNLVYPTGNDFAPTKLHCVGKIVVKEYCEAKKDDNRYKVSLGTKFYRIRAEPVNSTRSSELCKRSSKREKQNGNFYT